QASSIADLGALQATGLSQRSPPRVCGIKDGQAVLWQGGVLTVLFPSAHAASSASGVNDAGVVVGTDPSRRPYYWRKGVETILTGEGSDVPTPAAVNDSGIVAGTVGSPPVGWRRTKAGGGAPLAAPAGTPVDFTRVTAISSSGLVAGSVHLEIGI